VGLGGRQLALAVVVEAAQMAARRGLKLRLCLAALEPLVAMVLAELAAARPVWQRAALVVMGQLEQAVEAGVVVV
jgi:hypothetical protein